MYKRGQNFKRLGTESCFLWGPRQTGKSTLLTTLFPNSLYYDLLLASEFERLLRRPSSFREELLIKNPIGQPIIVDEVQKIPSLLDEIQWLMVNKSYQFILCGSSARKLKRGSGNLLGGRAFRYELFPLTSSEIDDFDLLRALNHGLLPRHYLGNNVHLMLQSYVGEYLKEEIAAEALVRKMPAFNRFLEVAAFSNGEVINYQNIAAECGVGAASIKGYFQILEDTLIGCFLPAYRKRPKRRIIQSPKFYFFDVGLVNFLIKRGEIREGGDSFGRAFEHFIFQELRAHSHYSGLSYNLSYWRTTSQFEVDFILGEHEVAVEIKGVDEVSPHHLRNLKAFIEEYAPRRAIIVSRDHAPRVLDGIEVLPWKIFLDQLWQGKIIQ
jgi:predicted AAA+ superfamily ATPase